MQLEHRDLALRRTVAIDFGKGRLAQEGLVDELGAEQRQLLRRRQRVLADDARHALEIGLRFQQRQQPLALRMPFRIAALGPPGGKAHRVLGIGLQRMDGGIEARLRAFAIESPERAHIALGMAGDRLGEIAGRRTDRADDGERAVGAPRASSLSRRVRRTRPSASRDRPDKPASPGSSPSRPDTSRNASAQRLVESAIKRDVQALVAEIFADGDCACRCWPRARPPACSRCWR